MKKFIAAALVLASVSAFAHDHEDNRHMVTLSGYETGDVTDRSLDLGWSHSTRSAAGGNSYTRNIALNYAYAIVPAWQVGVRFRDTMTEQAGNKQGGGTDATNTTYRTWGLQVIYNLAGRVYDTNYVSLSYDMGKADKTKGASPSDAFTDNTWGLAFGHRFSLGQIWGMDFNWSPELRWTMLDRDYKASGKKNQTTDALAFNVLKVDVLF